MSDELQPGNVIHMATDHYRAVVAERDALRAEVERMKAALAHQEMRLAASISRNELLEAKRDADIALAVEAAKKRWEEDARYPF